MELINDIILQAAASPWLVLVVFSTAVIDGFFPPVPSETVLVAAAAVAATTGEFGSMLLVCGVAALGAAIGDNVAYLIGRAVGTVRFRWMRGERVAAAFARAESALEDRGAPLILGARYIPVGRVAVNMTAGALRYPQRRFVLLSCIAGVLWAVFTTCLGLLAGSWFAEQPLLGSLVGIVLALVVGLVIDRVSAGGRRRSFAEHP